MNYYNFKKLTREEKFNERNKEWTINNPELYIRFLIIDNEKEILTKIENENKLKFDFSYKTKSGILLTLALEKHAYDVIDLLIDKKLEIKESDMMYFIKNFRDDDTSKYYEILDNHLNKFNVNNILKSLSDYYYDDNIEYFVTYLIDNQIEIIEEIKKELKEISNLSLIFKKEDVINNYKKLDDKLDSKQSSKKTKI